MAREGVLVDPYKRLGSQQVERLHKASLSILMNPGLVCYNRKAAQIFSDHGAEISFLEGPNPYWLIHIPERIIADALDSAPKLVKLGARDENNALILDGREPRVRFASGSEANNWLEIEPETFVSKRNPDVEVNLPMFRLEKGTADRLAKAAHLCEYLDNWDSFLRTLNIQDDDVTTENHDVNKFFASLNNTTKHVMAGLTDLGQLDNVIRMAEIIAGGKEKLEENPILSFITCLVKSPLQFMDDVTEKCIEIAKRGLPLVISSSPQGGSTAPITEEGMVAQINAEILAGIALTQMVNKGTPVLYGAVPVRARMDDLNDSYGVPEFNQYNIDCIQMARFYGLPCYSTAGVSDVHVPGIQASVERLLSHILVPLAGAQYIHYAFGLLERTDTFCPVQAVLDDSHIGMVKRFAAPADITADKISQALDQVQRVMRTSHKLYTRFVRSMIRAGAISPGYPFESKDFSDQALLMARDRMEEIMSLPRHHIDKETQRKVFNEIPGLLARLKE